MSQLQDLGEPFLMYVFQEKVKKTFSWTFNSTKLKRYQ